MIFQILLFCLLFWSGFSLEINVGYSANRILFATGDNCGLNWTLPVRLIEVQPGQYYFGSFGCTHSRFQFKIFLKDETDGYLPHIGSLYQFDGVEGKFFVQPRFRDEIGSIEVVSQFYSPELKDTRDLNLYLPSSYLENPKHFIFDTVMILLDGQELWRYIQTIDQLHVEGRVQQSEALWIGVPSIYFSDKRYFEYGFEKCSLVTCDECGGIWNNTGGGTDLLLDFIQYTVMSYIRTNYHVAPDAKFGIVGSSFGGSASAYAAWSRPDFFSYSAQLSPNFSWNCNSLMNFMKTVKPQSMSSLRVYSDMGTAEEFVITKETFQLYSTFQQDVLGSRFSNYIEAGGVHAHSEWVRRFPKALMHLIPVRVQTQ